MPPRLLAPCLAALALAVSGPTQAAADPLPPLRSGDVVFQTSRSAQSQAIQRATCSPWSHVGLVEVAPDGVFVIEAEARVVRTPWAAFQARGAGGRVRVMRSRLGAAALARVVADARRRLGTPYDPWFGWDDGRLYCSELVVKAYQRGAGVTLGRRERLGSLRLAGLEPAISKRYGRVPRELELVTPASLARDARLSTVFDGR